MKGKFSIVLHTHLPFCLGKGRWPFGEEWLFETVFDTYLPLLKVLNELVEEGKRFKIVVGLTPVLLEQLKSYYFKEKFLEYLDQKEELGKKDLVHFKGNPTYTKLTEYYLREIEDIRNLFVSLNEDIVSGFISLERKGFVELITSAATHAYLPLLKNDLSREVEVKSGVIIHKNWTGTSPSGFWLPECGYKPGVEEILKENGIKYFILDAHSLVEGREVIMEYGRRLPKLKIPSESKTFLPYEIKDDLYVFLRNPSTSEQVWSRDFGYPGDGVYREFHKKFEVSGFQYWKITDKNVPLGEKEIYNVDEAREKAKVHAHHFVSLLKEKLSSFYRESGVEGIILSAYDTELFGHWWYEGPLWLKEVLSLISEDKDIDSVSPSDFIKTGVRRKGLFRESSWGLGGFHYTWYNSETSWMWDMIHEDEDEFKSLFHKLSGKEGSLLLKEFLLELSSDWPFLVTTSQAKDYGKERFLEHRRKFLNIVEFLKGTKRETIDLDKIETEDFIFKDLMIEDLRR